MKNDNIFFSYLLHDLKSLYNLSALSLSLKSKVGIISKITKVQQRENKNLRNDYANFFKKIKERLRNDYANR